MASGRASRQSVPTEFRFLSSPGIPVWSEGFAIEPSAVSGEWDGRVTDEHTESQIEYLESALEHGMTVRIDVSFIPVGTFTNHRGISQEQFLHEVQMHKQRFQVVGSPGSKIQQVKYTIERYLGGLCATYDGHFMYRIDSYDMSQPDWWMERRIYDI